MIRQPIVTVLGHVDHGKTTLLDSIRQTAVAGREAGAITQHLGASEAPADFLRTRCADLLKTLKIEVTIPGLLFLDTPGHKAFSNLRRRGGALADLAVLVVDASQGFQPQTRESIKILKHNKTPFVVAANKIDLIRGWQAGNPAFLFNLPNQERDVQYVLDEWIYKIAAELASEGFDSDRYDRVENYTNRIAIIPTSAKTGEGIPDLLAILAGLAQKYLLNKLQLSKEAKGTVLEIKKLTGMGTAADIILYDGTLKVSEEIALAGFDGPITTKIRSILRPRPLDEIRDPKETFARVNSVTAAAGVRIVAPGMEAAIAGGPLLTGSDAAARIKQEIEAIRVSTKELGLVVKADALGSLEAIGAMLSEEKIPLRHADIGPISRRDIVTAADVAQKDELLGIILGFSVPVMPEAQTLADDKGIKILTGNVIYQIIEEYKSWVKQKTEDKRKLELEGLPRAAKFRLLPGYVFRQSKPAVVGIEVELGVLTPGAKLINSKGVAVGSVKELQKESETVSEIKKGDRGAVAIEEAIVGRTIEEGEQLFTSIDEDSFAKLESLRELLTSDEVAALGEIAQLMRKQKPAWGMKF